MVDAIVGATVDTMFDAMGRCNGWPKCATVQKSPLRYSTYLHLESRHATKLVVIL